MLETKQLYFRPYEETDLPFLLTMSQDEQVMRYIGAGVTWTEAEAAERIQRFMKQVQQYGYGFMVAMHRQEARPVGHAGILRQQVDDKTELEIGYWIARSHWGQGLASEAAIAWRQYGEQQLNQQRLISLIHPANKASAAVARKNNMVLEGEIMFRSKPVLLYTTNPRRGS